MMEISLLSRFWFWYLLLTVIAAAVAIYSYRRSYPPLSRGWRISLAVLRGIATLLLGLLLLEPLIDFRSDRVIKSKLAVLVDDTPSMGVAAEGVPRIQLADSLVSGAIAGTGGDYDIYTFSSNGIKASNLPGDSDLTGDATRDGPSCSPSSSSRRQRPPIR